MRLFIDGLPERVCGQYIEQERSTMGVKTYMSVLGFKMTDKVTEFSGVAESVCFDLYGCVQVAIRPVKLTDKGDVQDSRWFDFSRLRLDHDRARVMEPTAAWFDDHRNNQDRNDPKGPAEKPALR
jgi:hypothetical protein